MSIFISSPDLSSLHCKYSVEVSPKTYCTNMNVERIVGKTGNCRRNHNRHMRYRLVPDHRNEGKHGRKWYNDQWRAFCPHDSTGTRVVTAVFKGARQRSSSWARRIQSTPSEPTGWFWNSTLIQSSHLRIVFRIILLDLIILLVKGINYLFQQVVNDIRLTAFLDIQLPHLMITADTRYSSDPGLLRNPNCFSRPTKQVHDVMVTFGRQTAQVSAEYRIPWGYSQLSSVSPG